MEAAYCSHSVFVYLSESVAECLTSAKHARSHLLPKKLSLHTPVHVSGLGGVASENVLFTALHWSHRKPKNLLSFGHLQPYSDAIRGVVPPFTQYPVVQLQVLQYLPTKGVSMQEHFPLIHFVPCWHGMRRSSNVLIPSSMPIASSTTIAAPTREKTPFRTKIETAIFL